MRLEFVRKSPGVKLTLWWGKEGQATVYAGTHSHPFVKFYFFKQEEK